MGRRQHRPPFPCNWRESNGQRRGLNCTRRGRNRQRNRCIRNGQRNDDRRGVHGRDCGQGQHGPSDTASGDYAWALGGNRTVASGHSSYPLGDNAEASGRSAVAIGTELPFATAQIQSPTAGEPRGTATHSDAIRVARATPVGWNCTETIRIQSAPRRPSDTPCPQGWMYT